MLYEAAHAVARRLVIMVLQAEYADMILLAVHQADLQYDRRATQVWRSPCLSMELEFGALGLGVSNRAFARFGNGEVYFLGQVIPPLLPVPIDLHVLGFHVIHELYSEGVKKQHIVL